MDFQFQCPQGHLLQGDPSQAGQQCNCPTCGMLFIIPAPVAPVEAAPEPAFIGVGSGRRGAAPGMAGGGFSAGPAAPAQPEILHIPCPNGHPLETPVEMLDQDVLCPQCNAQFKLRRKDSLEHKKKKEEEARIREAKLGNAWLNWAIVAVVIVILGLGIMIAVSQFGAPPPE